MGSWESTKVRGCEKNGGGGGRRQEKREKGLRGKRKCECEKVGKCEGDKTGGSKIVLRAWAGTRGADNGCWARGCFVGR